MISNLIPGFEAELETLRTIGNRGFFVGFGINLSGAEHMQNEFPEGWQEEYQKGIYYIADPVLIWVFSKTGRARWSKIPIADVRGVMIRARAYEMNYGAVFARHVRSKKCFLSVARNDRELTDDEMSNLDARFDAWTTIILDRAALTDKELNVLRLLRDGEGQAAIADRLGISEATVKKRANTACAKLGARNRTQAVAIAMARRYLDQ